MGSFKYCQSQNQSQNEAQLVLDEFGRIIMPLAAFGIGRLLRRLRREALDMHMRIELP